MGFEDSPSLDLYKEGLPSELPDPSKQRKRMQIWIGALAGLVLILGVINLLQSDKGGLLTGTGTLTGTIVDNEGQPVQAEVFVVRSDVEAQTDRAGRFEIKGVPEGDQTVVVAYMFAGQEFPVRVKAGEAVDMGRIPIVTTPRPGDYEVSRLEWR